MSLSPEENIYVENCAWLTLPMIRQFAFWVHVRSILYALCDILYRNFASRSDQSSCIYKTIANNFVFEYAHTHTPN